MGFDHLSMPSMSLFPVGAGVLWFVTWAWANLRPSLNGATGITMVCLHNGLLLSKPIEIGNKPDRRDRLLPAVDEALNIKAEQS
jgi:hypothetical protein